eukprot:303490-Pyramimonas_sp.AAC.1
MMFRAKRARPPLARHRGAQGCEDVSSETRQTMSRACSECPVLRGCFKRNELDIPAHIFKEPGVARMSQAERLDHLARSISDPRIERMFQAAPRPLARAQFDNICVIT